MAVARRVTSRARAMSPVVTAPKPARSRARSCSGAVSTWKPAPEITGRISRSTAAPSLRFASPSARSSAPRGPGGSGAARVSPDGEVVARAAWPSRQAAATAAISTGRIGDPGNTPADDDENGRAHNHRFRAGTDRERMLA